MSRKRLFTDIPSEGLIVLHALAWLTSEETDPKDWGETKTPTFPYSEIEKTVRTILNRRGTIKDSALGPIKDTLSGELEEPEERTHWLAPELKATEDQTTRRITLLGLSSLRRGGYLVGRKGKYTLSEKGEQVLEFYT